MSRVLIWIIQFYQCTAGRVLPRACRFEPTCSTYAIQAIREHGPLRGSALSIWRVLRCNPLSTGGWDPIPERMDENE
ncbi:membrane protein insertion efficiency factor YidD [candidate division WOR-3 bacterium]|nr:membrane protein insertion efficiency factor YidD [candidate division WOR-3 bacterium]